MTKAGTDAAVAGTKPSRAKPPKDLLPTDPVRLRAFARFFKNYMSVSSVVVAALPIPATAIGAIDVFSDDKKMLSAFTSLFCFLTLGYIFYQRHALARWMFPEFTVDDGRGPASDDSTGPWIPILVKRVYTTMMPLLLIVSAALLARAYCATIDEAVSQLSVQYPSLPTRAAILAHAYLVNPQAQIARGYYVGMFICAEAAFIMMATKEYLQDLLRIGEIEAMQLRRSAPPVLPADPLPAPSSVPGGDDGGES